jgi:copper chaperone CopZ
MISPEIISHLNQISIKKIHPGQPFEIKSCFEFEYFVPQMKCEGCANKIKNELNAISDVDAIVIFQHKLLKITSDSEIDSVIKFKLFQLGYDKVNLINKKKCSDQTV